MTLLCIHNYVVWPHTHTRTYHLWQYYTVWYRMIQQCSWINLPLSKSIYCLYVVCSCVCTVHRSYAKSKESSVRDYLHRLKQTMKKQTNDVNNVVIEPGETRAAGSATAAQTTTSLFPLVSLDTGFRLIKPSPSCSDLDMRRRNISRYHVNGL